jgi:hypothetical protein
LFDFLGLPGFKLRTVLEKWICELLAHKPIYEVVKGTRKEKKRESRSVVP